MIDALGLACLYLTAINLVGLAAHAAAGYAHRHGIGADRYPCDDYQTTRYDELDL